MGLRFLHLADLHLDTAFGGRQEAARQRLREGTRQAFEAAVDFALEQGLDALLVAGDGFDEPRLEFATELWLSAQVERLARGGVHLVWIAGNHDPGAASGKLARMGLGRSTAWGERVHVVGAGKPVCIDIHGPKGKLRGRIVAAGHTSSKVTENLAARFRPQTVDVPVVGLLHTQVHAARSSTEHAAYAPSSAEDLAAPGYDYWALGHVHLRQRPFAEIPAWYAGNLCGRNPKETGPKGGLLVELEPGVPAAPEFISFAPVRWEQLEVRGLGAVDSAGALLEHLLQAIHQAQENAPETELLVRLIPSGPCPMAACLRSHEERAAIEEELRLQSGLLEVQLRPHRLHVARDLSELRSSPSALGNALDLIEGLAEDPQLLAELAPDLAFPDGSPAQLLEGLGEELLQRVLPEPDAGASE
ncbi:MAG: exonuclease SbcD [Planctomycetota bacterium]|jgi:exonuclease SbcD